MSTTGWLKLKCVCGRELGGCGHTLFFAPNEDEEVIFLQYTGACFAEIDAAAEKQLLEWLQKRVEARNATKENA
jgi:hypothetical protein